MDSAEQAIGEKRVRSVLIDPLLRRGLAKPGSLTKAQFDDMLGDLCARLAYMSEANLAALEEQAAQRPTGKDKDRFPIANNILSWAADIQPPSDSASPLIRAVFASSVGRDALAGDWAPELLVHLRTNRMWPAAFSITKIQERANGAVQRVADIEARRGRGAFINDGDLRFAARRAAAVVRCEEIAAMGKLEAAE